MGRYLNPKERKFYMSTNSEIFRDKSELLIHTGFGDAGGY